MSITFSHALPPGIALLSCPLAKWRTQDMGISGFVRVAPKNLLIMKLDICRQLLVSRGQQKGIQPKAGAFVRVKYVLSTY